MIIFNKLGMKENFLNLINQFLKPKIMSYLSEMLNFLSLRLGIRQMCLLLHFY